MFIKFERMTAAMLVALVPLVGALAYAECPDGKVEVIRTTPSGKTHIQCVSEIAANGLEQSAENSAGTVTYASFKSLGQLIPEGSHHHVARRVSADGSTVVGIAYYWDEAVYNAEAFRWTEADGMVGLGDFEGGRFFSGAFGVSGDGSVVVGRGVDEVGPRAFRWSIDSNGMTRLPDDDCSERTIAGGAWGVSDDGTVIAGACDGVIYRWVEGLGKEPLHVGSSSSQPFDISADGSVIVGQLYHGSPPLFYEAFRWSESNGWSQLGALDGAASSISYGVSPDGSVAVGRSGFSTFQWTEASNMTALPGGNGYVYDASADGSVIVGKLLCGDASRAAIWIQGGEPLILQELLESQGIDLSGWWLLSAQAVTPDGRVIVGNGVIDPPATCEEIDDDVDMHVWIATVPLP